MTSHSARAMWWTPVLRPSLLVFASLFVATVWTALALRSNERDRFALQTAEVASEWQGRLESYFERVSAPLRALRDQWQREGGGSPEQFFAESEEDLTRPWITSAVWAGADGKVIHLAQTAGAKRTAATTTSTVSMADEEGEAKQIAVDRERARVNGGNIVEARYTDDGPEVDCVIPLFQRDQSFAGALVARASMRRYAAQWLAAFPPGYRVRLAGGPSGRVLYSNDSNGNSAQPDAPPSAKAVPPPELSEAVKSFVAGGMEWELRVAPTEAYAASAVGRVPRWVFLSGIVASLLVSALVFQALRGRTVQHEHTRRYLRALEQLADIAIAISARIDSPREVLDHLARAAGDLLGMESSGIALHDPATDELKVLAVAGRVPPQARMRYAMSELPLCRRVLDSRRVAFVADADAADVNAQVNREVVRSFGVAAMIIIPLYVGERPLGLMFVGDSRGRDGDFSDSERRLAALLGGQAAVILSNSDLYKRMADAMRAQQRLFEQREAIFAVNAAVYQASSFEESLQIIAELAPGVLDVDLCMVTLNYDDDDRFFVAAVTRPYGADLVNRSFLRKGTNDAIVRATRRMMVVEEARSHPGIHPAFRAQVEIGSVAYLPLLRVGGEFMGTLVLVRRASGPFRPEQLNLAEMFTSRAAAAIENARLLDQTRRDAEAKTMLLRELNHRVKNNLASIITLLSLDEPVLSRAARQWLDRAIDRIRTMARTHDLFSGGMDRIPLEELVEQVIPSLSVVKPPGVVVRRELENARVMLRTDRAVSLAMVLHELCSNAIIHGTGSHGTVTIRARMRAAERPTPQRAGTVVIEVLDEGRLEAAMQQQPVRERAGTMAMSGRHGGTGGAHDGEVAQQASVSEPSASRGVHRVGVGGLGLMLVDGLVTRELGGTFSREDRDGGGSVARAEIPVGADEIARLA